MNVFHTNIWQYPQVTFISQAGGFKSRISSKLISFFISVKQKGQIGDISKATTNNEQTNQISGAMRASGEHHKLMSSVND